jgi:hypothetical protein
VDGRRPAADGSGFDPSLRRARLTLGLRVPLGLVRVTGDAAERRLVEAALDTGWMWQEQPDEGHLVLAVQAGRLAVPIGLERIWAESKLPFLEPGVAVGALAPPAKQHGVLVGVSRLQLLHYDHDDVRLWHATLGLVQPVEDRGGDLGDSFAVVGRALLFRHHDQVVGTGLIYHLHAGVSGSVGTRTRSGTPAQVATTSLGLPLFDGSVAGATLEPAGRQQRAAIELDARYRRVRFSAEGLYSRLATRTQPAGEPAQDGSLVGWGGSATVAITLRGSHDWWGQPLVRASLRDWRFVSPASEYSDQHSIHYAYELDLGAELLRLAHDAAGLDGSLRVTVLRSGAHVHVNEYLRLSVQYGFTTAAGALATGGSARTHEIGVRAQTAF